MHSAVAMALHPGVVLAANPSFNLQKRPIASKNASLKMRRPALQGAAFRFRKHQPDLQCLELGGLSRADFSLRAGAEAQTYGTVISEMAVNVFGEVVDDSVLQEFGMDPTQENRARLAMRFINYDDKRGQATRFVNNLKQTYGNGASTLCLVYNASGDPLRYAAHQDWWNGSLFRHGYPSEIGNGQWAAFLHVKNPGAASGSLGAVVYRGKNRREQDRDFLLAWSTPWSLAYTNKAYCQIGAVNFFEGRWDEIYNTLDNSNYTSISTADGVQIQAETERGTSPTFTTIISQY